MCRLFVKRLLFPLKTDPGSPQSALLIQPIAIQISKLRFFISLVCDQLTNRSKKENHGIRPLPNLETKFVAADIRPTRAG